MRGIGVVQDGFPFTHAELDRGVPRFWWSAGRKNAYREALARRGGDGGGDAGIGCSSVDPRLAAGVGAAAVVAGVAADGGVSWGSTDSGTSSDGGGSSGQ